MAQIKLKFQISIVATLDDVFNLNYDTKIKDNSEEGQFFDSTQFFVCSRFFCKINQVYFVQKS